MINPIKKIVPFNCKESGILQHEAIMFVPLRCVFDVNRINSSGTFRVYYTLRRGNYVSCLSNILRRVFPPDLSGRHMLCILLYLTSGCQNASSLVDHN
jgi:hypothetical protein